MATTTHLGIVLLEQSQAQKDVTANEAFARIDALLNTGFISRTLATPPVSPAEGDVYIVAPTATGAWAGHEDDAAYFDGGIWRFIAPNAGLHLWSQAEDRHYVYFDGAWVAEGNRQLGYDQAQYQVLKTLTDGASIAWDVRYQTHATVTLGGNRTLANPTNAQAGGVYLLIVRQDATGGRTLAFDSAYAFAGGAAPTLTSAANAVDMLTFVYDGSKMLGVAVLNLL